MALSNWDTMAWDTDGKPCAGTTIFQNKIRVSIYKNWLHIEDLRKKYQKVSSTVNSGDFSFHVPGTRDWVDVKARRGPQESVYVYIEYTHCWNKGKKYNFDKLRFFGIGCYGYDSEVWVGVKPETEIYFKDWLYRGHKFEQLDFGEGGKITGSHTERGPIAYDLPTLETGMRYNQGDGFFADEIGTDGQITKAGEAKGTIFMRMLTGKDDTKKGWDTE